MIQTLEELERAIPFARRHIGPSPDDQARMLAFLGYETLDDLAEASVPDSITDPDGYYGVNVVGTKNVLDAMRRAGVTRIVFSSTAATYGRKARPPASYCTG